MTPWYLPAIRFSLQLLISEIPFFTALKPRRGLWWRAIISIILYEGMVIGTRWCLLRLPTYNEWISLSFYLIVFFYTFLIMGFCFKIQPKSFLFCGVGGYAIEHVAFCISTMIKYYVTQRVTLNTVTDHIFFRILPYILVGLVVYFTLIRRGNKQGKLENSSLKMTLVSALILCSCVFFKRIRSGAEISVPT